MLIKILNKLALVFLLGLSLASCTTVGGVLHPAGVIASQERTLLFDSVALMLIVVIPVIIMSVAFALRYRSTHKTSDYKPNWSHNVYLEAIWWGVPMIIIVVLGVLTYKKTHQLDPYKKIDVPGKPLLIEAVAMQWKWLFLYPKQGIATVNYVEIPNNRQVQFYITADAPMSSFFIPQLGSQIYAMAGMRTRLHLLPNREGTYEGMNSQYNGDGFSDMKFKAKVVSIKEFDNWVSNHKKVGKKLDLSVYRALSKPTIDVKPIYYSSFEPKGLFKRIMVQYTKPNMNLH